MRRRSKRLLTKSDKDLIEPSRSRSADSSPEKGELKSNPGSGPESASLGAPVSEQAPAPPASVEAAARDDTANDQLEACALPFVRPKVSYSAPGRRLTANATSSISCTRSWGISRPRRFSTWSQDASH